MKASVSMPGSRRFYREVTVAPDDHGGHRLLLDAHALKTPAGAAVVLPTAAAAERLAAEWRQQGDAVDLGRMGLTRLVFTAVDRERRARDAWIEEVTRYATSDLLVHIAEGPTSLADLQRAKWSPWLAWAREALGVDLSTTVGVMPQPQSSVALRAIGREAAKFDGFALVALVAACGLFGSAVLALAMAHGALTGEAAHTLARLDEAWQETQWGEDAEAVSRTAGRLAEARELDAWLAALRSG